MIGDIATRVAADLRERRFPYTVTYGPERVGRDGFKPAIVFSRDRGAGDPIAAVVQANHRNPRVSYMRNVSGKVLVYARSSKAASTVFDHEEECDRVCDGVITALYEILTAAKFPITFTESRLLTRDELRAEAETDASDDRSGARSADWPGCAARIRFFVGTKIRRVTYPGAAGPEGEVFQFAPPTVTVDFNADDDE